MQSIHVLQLAVKPSAGHSLQMTLAAWMVGYSFNEKTKQIILRLTIFNSALVLHKMNTVNWTYGWTYLWSKNSRVFVHNNSLIFHQDSMLPLENEVPKHRWTITVIDKYTMNFFFFPFTAGL